MAITARMLDQGYLLGLLMENAPVGIAVLTTDLRYVLVSRMTAEQLLEMPSDQIVGRHCYDLMGQYRDDPSRAGLERVCDGCPCLRALTTGETASIVRKVREGLVIHSRAVPLLDEAEDRVGVMQVIENIADKVFDPLTGVHNYRYYDELTAQEGYRATRYDTPLSLIALDLNRFKDVNDRFGHIKGDLVLRDVAQSLEHAVRESDHLCRIGGDEFAVLAPHTTFQEGQALAQRIEEAIAGEFAPFNLSIAAGVASYPKDTMDPKRLREIADRRLYRAKTLLGSSPPGQTPPAQDGR